MKAFQNDLKNGMSLQEALCKHNLTFKEAVIRCHHHSARTNSKYHNIYLNGKKFIVEKQVYDERVRFSFEELTDAVKVRDYLDEHGWSKEAIMEVEAKIC